MNVVDLGVVIEPVKTNLMFDFNPSGKTNAGTDRLWTDGRTGMSVSDNFDWVNGGYQLDKDGDTYFCVKAGTRATINYKLFADDAKKLGKNFTQPQSHAVSAHFRMDKARHIRIQRR